LFKFVKHQSVKLEDTQYEENQLIPECLFYACRCPIGECLNAMPDCPDQFLFKEWSTVSSTMLIQQQQSNNSIIISTTLQQVHPSNWLRLHTADYIMKQQIQLYYSKKRVSNVTQNGTTNIQLHFGRINNSKFALTSKKNNTRHCQ